MALCPGALSPSCMVALEVFINGSIGFGQDSFLLLGILWALEAVIILSHVTSASGILSQQDTHFQLSGTSPDKNLC